MSFCATEFEFRHRFWFISGIFFAAFMCYWFDHVNASIGLSRALIAAGRQHNPDQISLYIRGCRAFGAILLVSAAFMRTWAEAYLHSSIVHDANLHSDRLVADGPYRHLRNPLYLGLVLGAAGTGFLASRVGIIVLVAGMTLFAHRLIIREESSLLASQGEGYRRYFQSVPRWLPSLTPRIPASGRRPNWLDAFMGELFMWGWAAGMVLLVATNRMLYYWMAFGIGFAIYFLQAKKRKNGDAPLVSLF